MYGCRTHQRSVRLGPCIIFAGFGFQLPLTEHFFVLVEELVNLLASIVQTMPAALTMSKVSAEERNFLFSSESVNEGHPDKLSDQVSDAVLDACLKADPYSKVACETATKDNMVCRCLFPCVWFVFEV